MCIVNDEHYKNMKVPLHTQAITLDLGRGICLEVLCGKLERRGERRSVCFALFPVCFKS